jgi:hypothetical protein
MQFGKMVVEKGKLCFHYGGYIGFDKISGGTQNAKS